MEWLKDSNWNMKHKDKEIYLMVNHKWAFPVWEMANFTNKIKDNAVLVHIDSHLDDIPELVSDERYFNITSEQDIIDLIKYEQNEENYLETKNWIELEQANFIFPSFLRNTIQDIIHISDDTQEEITMESIYEADSNDYSFNTERNDMTSDHILSECRKKVEGKNKSIRRYISIEEFISNAEPLPSSQSKILDIDLDYFNDSNSFSYADLKSDDVIKKNLMDIKNLYDWDIVTVALSPLYCGSYEACLHILTLFLEVFELNDQDFSAWI